MDARSHFPDPRGTDARIGALTRFAARSRNVARQSIIDAAACEAVEALSRAGLDCLVLKGIVLSRVLFGAGEERGYFDADLLVSPARLADAGRALAGLGYENMTAIQGIDDLTGVLHAQVWS